MVDAAVDLTCGELKKLVNLRNEEYAKLGNRFSSSSVTAIFINRTSITHSERSNHPDSDPESIEQSIGGETRCNTKITERIQEDLLGGEERRKARRGSRRGEIEKTERFFFFFDSKLSSLCSVFGFTHWSRNFWRL